ncbi:hypothetical protein [Sandaracinus amylolyticus]|uniref:hypothetical protein n=1 Tax=Sandaracinus amylolyticus TaxID=927083 RepID=UPI00069CE10A|nr:hypothetical protein [Sandaracinus amylolyticus]
MTDLEALLAGDRAAVAALHEGDATAWKALLAHVRAGDAAPAPLVDAMLALDPELASWRRRTARGIDVAIDTISAAAGREARARVQAWIAEGVRRARPADDPAVLDLRLQEAKARTGPDALPALRALVADLRGASATMRFEALMLVAQRAHEARAIDEGLTAVREAAALAGGEPRRAARALRREGALLLVARRVDDAIALLRPAMATPGPLFGGDGKIVLGAPADDAFDEALDEAATIATWATWRTPEWVCALGGIAETSREREDARQALFVEALDAMTGASQTPVADLEVVVRQASQRGLTRTADTAVARLVERFADDLRAASVAGAHLLATGRARDAWRVHERAARATVDRDEASLALLRAAEIACGTGDLDDAERLLALVLPRDEDRDRVRLLRLELSSRAARARSPQPC